MLQLTKIGTTIRYVVGRAGGGCGYGVFCVCFIWIILNSWLT